MTVERIAKKSSAIYEKANTVTQQSFGQIRTVAAYSQQEALIKQYKETLDEPYKLGINQVSAEDIEVLLETW